MNRNPILESIKKAISGETAIPMNEVPWCVRKGIVVHTDPHRPNAPRSFSDLFGHNGHDHLTIA